MSREIHHSIIKLLESRGIHRGQFDQFFSWDLKDIPDLTQMIDLTKASERIITAIKANESIAIYGDYDVDGTTSCALLYHFFEMLKVKVKLIQPSRFKEGYGIHESSIIEAHEQNINVIITVDCGITGHAASFKAKELGIDLIITDHHKDASPELPCAYAIINPNRRDEPDSPLKCLAGVGVAFALAHKIRGLLLAKGQEIPSLYPLLTFVAIGTIADLAHLNYLNMRLVRHGLKLLQNPPYPGLRAFFTPDELKYPISSEKVSFQIGPLINSKGRLDHPELALNLLISDNFENARSLYLQLETTNNERKFIQSQVYTKAKEQFISQGPVEDQVCAVLYASDWHEGVIGIVASRIVETFRIPAIIFTDAEEEGVIKASARTAGELNLFDILKSLDSFFIKFGGHKAAAGLSMKKENFNAFKIALAEQLHKIPAILRTKPIDFDLEINQEDIDAKLVKDLQLLEPFGNGNPKPTFRAKNLLLHSYKILKDVHVRWTFANEEKKAQFLQGISFNFVNKWDQLSPEEIYQNKSPLSAYFNLGINRFNGNEYIQLQVQRIEWS